MPSLWPKSCKGERGIDCAGVQGSCQVCGIGFANARFVPGDCEDCGGGVPDHEMMATHSQVRVYIEYSFHS